MARIISIISKQPGTGKSTVALNLALALHNMKQKAVVVDADFLKPNISEHLGITDLPVHIGDVLDGRQHMLDSVYKHASGLRIVPSLTVNNYENLRYHLEDLTPDNDYILLDTPSQSPHLERIASCADEALIVHSPYFSSYNVLETSRILKKNRILNLGIVLNKSMDDSVHSIFDMPVLRTIAEHPHVKKSFVLKHPVLYTHPKSKVSKEFSRLAQRFIL